MNSVSFFSSNVNARKYIVWGDKPHLRAARLQPLAQMQARRRGEAVGEHTSINARLEY